MADGRFGSFSEDSDQGRYDAIRHGSSPDLPRILVTEHDQSIAEFLCAFLQGEGYEPSLAPSLEMALKNLDEQTFHVVLTDLFTVNPRRPFSQVRRLLQHALPTPVGLITGWSVSPEAARRHGFAFVLSKPFELDQVLAEITACLEPHLTPTQEQQFQVLERFSKALQTNDQQTLEQLVTEDVVYYPPQQARAFSAPRIRGRAAVLAYAQQASTHYQNVTFDGFLFYPRPKGWVLRFSSHWSISHAPPLNLTGTLLIHFRGNQIHQIGMQWSNKYVFRSLEQTRRGI